MECVVSSIWYATYSTWSMVCMGMWFLVWNIWYAVCGMGHVVVCGFYL